MYHLTHQWIVMWSCSGRRHESSLWETYLRDETQWQKYNFICAYFPPIFIVNRSTTNAIVSIFSPKFYPTNYKLQHYFCNLKQRQ